MEHLTTEYNLAKSDKGDAPRDIEAQIAFIAQATAKGDYTSAIARTNTLLTLLKMKEGK